MKHNTETFTTGTLQTLTPELGHFVITGDWEIVQEQEKFFDKTHPEARAVSSSSFERALRGQAPRRFRLGQLLAG